MPHRLLVRPSGLLTGALAVASGLVVAAAGLVGTAPGARAAGAVDLQRGSDYLAGQLTGAPGVTGRYAAGFGQADLGLTIDTGLALAATGRDQSALADVVAFVEHGTDPNGQSLGSWTGITDHAAGVRPDYRSGGSIAKAVVLEQVVGHDPASVGGLDLLTNLAETVCRKPDANGCAARGNYRYATSVFSQALGVVAQTRAGQDATRPLAYLAGLQAADGSFPSLLPSSGDQDVDSTAMAAMALDLVPGHSAAVDRAVAWVASRQGADGGFAGTSGSSLNTAGLAAQGLALRPSTYGATLARVRAFLGAHQNADGGFGISTTETASDVRASAQALGGAVGTSFGTLRLATTLPGAGAGGSPPPTGTPTPRPTGPRPTSPAPRPSTPAPVPAGAGGSGSGGGAVGPRTGPALGSGVGPGAPGTGSSSPTPAASATSTPSTSSPSSSSPSTPSPSSPSSASGTATASGAGSTPPPTAGGPSTQRTSATTGGVNPLWWVVLAVAVGFGVVLVRTLRGRPTPARHPGAHR
ncbi:prenyltransferase/squalene oxidase repeat-containing protein [Lapillicoccus jejuensis]|uniref:Prenyltransferase/squalene oxidase-like repeat protein n=1 Tax=Lapillicoccus jejuensis TaxID=402171 RepID=A0A542DYB9_9MICO|nr:prenyltransferase/squalene oxidase repeat-containing protein [Lapillicoccus jejuensis]TQJ08036.1 prenyltransferase/squalene oxidase-like repeat protein [Lapillicoccus jejuensis]